jgi:hypothetical protein
VWHVCGTVDRLLSRSFLACQPPRASKVGQSLDEL